jgi:hypothetical protein
VKELRPLVVLVVAIVCSWLAVAKASDPTALYARVERVVLAPNSDAPTTIQVWGVFSMAKPDDRNDYLPAARGYLYFKLAGSDDTARREWADLQRVAGAGQIVAFGSRYQLHARLRNVDEPPASPDPYVVSMGLTKVQGRTEYPPIRAIVDFRN